MNKTIATLVLALVSGVMILLMSIIGLQASDLAQPEATAQQETLEAVVRERFEQTAQAADTIAITQTVEAAFEQAVTATAAFEATVDAAIQATMIATGDFSPTSNDDWTPVERDFDGITMVLVP
ncbi:MAG: hypothetical protein EA396_12855, partial [Anaerolineaceae bacterium]